MKYSFFSLYDNKPFHLVEQTTEAAEMFGYRRRKRQSSYGGSGGRGDISIRDYYQGQNPTDYYNSDGQELEDYKLKDNDVSLEIKCFLFKETDLEICLFLV